MGEADCSICNAGEYQDQTAQAACKVCASGTINTADNTNVANHDAAADCVACAIGKSGKAGTAAADHDNADDCLICAAGEYQDATGQTACKDCIAGTFNANDNTN